MAGAYTAIADDADAMLWNPALLGKAGNRDRVSLTVLPSLSLGFGNNVLTIGELANLLDTQSVSPENVEGVLESLPGTGWRLILDAGTTLAFAMPGSHSGFFVNALADTKGLDFPRDIVALALQGNAAVPNVRIDNLQGSLATAYAAVGSSFAFPLGVDGGIGMNLRYLRGLGYARVNEASGSLLSISDSGEFSADARVETEVSTHGNGIAADFGVAGVLGERLTWGAVLGNVGVMHWNRIQIKDYTLKVDPFSIVDASGSVTDFGAVTRDALQVSDRVEASRETWLPPYARLSGAIRPWRPLTLSGEFQAGFGDGYGVSSIPELKLGSELRALDWLPLRAGFALGGDRGLLLATGAGLDFPGFRLDLAMGAMNGFGGHARGAYYSVSNTLRF